MNTQMFFSLKEKNQKNRLFPKPGSSSSMRHMLKKTSARSQPLRHSAFCGMMPTPKLKLSDHNLHRLQKGNSVLGPLASQSDTHKADLKRLPIQIVISDKAQQGLSRPKLQGSVEERYVQMPLTRFGFFIEFPDNRVLEFR